MIVSSTKKAKYQLRFPYSSLFISLFILLSFANGNFIASLTPSMMVSFTRRAALKWVGGASIILPLAGETYARAGNFYPSKLGDEVFQNSPSDWNDVEEITLIFHGAGGQDENTEELLTKLRKKNKEIKSYETVLDWSEGSRNILQASFNGERFGRLVAEQLFMMCGSSRSLKSIHFIGISVGSFAADAGVTRFRELMNDTKYEKREDSRFRRDIYIQLTLLDPFTQRGIIGASYGDRIFGKSADYAQRFLNTVRLSFSMIL